MSTSLPPKISMPRHVAIIMDGNGRWAQSRGKRRTFGHRSGVESVRAAVRYALKHGIDSLTLFAFSSENWNRPAEEVSVLMDLFTLVLRNEIRKLHKNGVRLNVIGDTTRFNEKLQRLIDKAAQQTAGNDKLVLNIAANYGGRWDMVHAAKQLACAVQRGELAPEQLDENQFNQFTSLSDQADVDLLIRTGGEQRISNFVLWQAAYAELYFTSVLWPEFDEQQFDLAVEEFTSRQRRFGMTGEQINSAEDVTC